MCKERGCIVYPSFPKDTFACPVGDRLERDTLLFCSFQAFVKKAANVGKLSESGVKLKLEMKKMPSGW